MAKPGAEVVDDGTGNLTSKGEGTMDLDAFDDISPGPGDEDIGGVDPAKSQGKDDDADDDSGDDDADASGDDKDGDGDGDKGATDAEKGTDKILAALKRISGRLDKLEGKSKKADDKGGKAPAKKDEGDDKPDDSDAKSGDGDSKIDKLVSAVGDLVTTSKAQATELAELRKSRGASNALDLDPSGEGSGDEPITDWDDMNRHRREGARS